MGPDTYTQEKCMVNLKFFNIVMKELGPDFLKKGIFFKSSDLTDFLINQSKDFWQGCKEILLNKKPVEYSLIEKGGFVLQNDLVFFSVKIHRKILFTNDSKSKTG